MTDNERLEPGTTAVLFFDFLNGHVKKEDAATRARYAPVVAAAQRLLEAARAGGAMVVFAAANHRADGGTTARTLTDTDNRLRPRGTPVPSEGPPLVGGSWATEVIPELAPRSEDYLVPKYRWSAFFGTYLDLALRTRGVRTLVLAGGSTDVGVASTAFAARDLDYNLVIAEDACTSPESDNHEQFMRRIFPRMARVRSVEQIQRLLA